MTKVWNLYRIVGPIVGPAKPYVGATCRSLEKRWYLHCYGALHHLRGCPALHEAIRLHGASQFTIELLATSDTENEARNLEVQFIDLFNSMTPHGYNSRRGTAHTASTRAKMRKARLGIYVGEKSGHSKLTGKQVTWATIRCGQGAKIKELAKELGVHFSTIARATSGETWGYV